MIEDAIPGRIHVADSRKSTVDLAVCRDGDVDLRGTVFYHINYCLVFIHTVGLRLPAFALYRVTYDGVNISYIFL